MLLRRAGIPFSYHAVPPGASGVRKRSLGAFPAQRKSHSAHLHTSQNKERTEYFFKDGFVHKTMHFQAMPTEKLGPEHWRISKGPRRRFPVAFLSATRAPGSVRPPRRPFSPPLLPFRNSRWQFSFRSLAPQGYAICYGANEGRQQNGSRAGGARARADPAARAHTQRAERLVQPNRDEDTCLWADYIVQ